MYHPHTYLPAPCVWHICPCLSLANPAPVCDTANGWQLYGSNCYKRKASLRKSWAAARSDCIREGGDLVSITSSEEEQYVTSRLDQSAFDLWIGFSTMVRIITWFHSQQWNMLNHLFNTKDNEERDQLFLWNLNRLPGQGRTFCHMLNNPSSNRLSSFLFTEMHNFILSNTTKCHDFYLVWCQYIHVHKLAGGTAWSHVRPLPN